MAQSIRDLVELRFRQALEVGQDLGARVLRTAGGEPADDLANGPVGELNVIIEGEAASVRSGIDFPTLIVAFEKITRGHAVGENLVLDPFSGLKVEVIRPAAGLLKPVEGGANPSVLFAGVLEYLQGGEPLHRLFRFDQIRPNLFWGCLNID